MSIAMANFSLPIFCEAAICKLAMSASNLEINSGMYDLIDVRVLTVNFNSFFNFGN